MEQSAEQQQTEQKPAADADAPKPEETTNQQLAATANGQDSQTNPEETVKKHENESNHTIKSELNGKSESATEKPTIPISEEDSKWHTVGIYQGINCNVTNYIDNSEWSSSGRLIAADDLPDLEALPRIKLEQGTAYRFRVRAINSCGASDWSEVSSFKTCLPGFPGAPSAIKISKSSEGAHLTWEPPPTCQDTNEIIEYSVYLAVKPNKDKDGRAIGVQTPPRTPAQLAFIRVYVGAANQCTVAQTSLSSAHVDCSNKPAIIFRIAARNGKGYGPATQVRWLQDPMQQQLNANTSPSRIKSELPLKRFKPV